MQKEGNNYAFIDSQNLNLAIRGQGWILDYRRFFIYLKEKYHVTKAFLFFGYIAKNKPLYIFLQKCGYSLIYKPILTYGRKPIKGNIDAELVLHAMIEYKNFKRAIIVTGDGDFHCLVNHFYKHNKLERLLIPDAYNYSGLLKPFAPDKVHFMNSLKFKLAHKKSP